MPLSSRTIRHIAVSLIIIFSAATTLLAQDSGTGWSYNSSSNTLTLSGSEVDWTAIKAFSSTTEKVVFADDFAVSSIPSQAFYEFSELTAIKIPNVVTSIGEYVFYDCRALTSISLPDGLTSMGEFAFLKCRSLTSITLPTTLTSIGGYAFSDCTSLISITLPDGLTSIGIWAFYNCTSLASISLPTTLTSIGSWAFRNCTSLNSVEILSNCTSDNKHVIYLGYDTDEKTEIGNYIFPRHQATLIYDPNTTWIGDDDYQNLRYYFNSFATPTSIHSNTISNSAPQYYDLSGRPVSPATHKGIAVKLQDGHSSMITVK